MKTCPTCAKTHEGNVCFCIEDSPPLHHEAVALGQHFAKTSDGATSEPMSTRLACENRVAALEAALPQALNACEAGVKSGVSAKLTSPACGR